MIAIFISVLGAIFVSIYLYSTFLIHLNRQKNQLNLSTILNKKLEEYGGLNLFRQDLNLWYRLGKELPYGDLRNRWIMADRALKLAILSVLIGGLGLLYITATTP